MTFSNPLWAFGAPPDAVAAACLVAALALSVGTAVAGRRPAAWQRLLALLSRHRRTWLALLALSALLLSAGYVHHYLRGGPRIIDASAYFLEARALAEGKLAFHVPSPTASFRGRFLAQAAVNGTEPNGGIELGVLFPPGYPALLSLGFLVDRPLWIGPLLAALLVLVTYALARKLSGDDKTALLAAALSVVSAALRYHTADTMSHGFAALLFSSALLAALPREEAPRWKSALWSAFGGLCLGWLFATRPVTAAVCALTCVLLVAPRHLRDVRSSLLDRAPWLLGVAPGLALFLFHQRAVTGDFWTSAQLHYYALADGPPGCFGLGFGSGKGCEFEHGDVVARFGEGGYSLRWVLLHTLHRLHGHSLDLANFEPLWLLVPWTLYMRRAEREARAFAFAIVGIVVAYAAFYFNGSYPGGGARFFAELLPLEHAVLAWGAQMLGKRRWVLPLALAGFALHASFSHRALMERDGGKPLFEERVIAAAGARAEGALVLVDSDPAFDLAHDPKALETNHGFLVARRRGDAHDRVLWERRGRPITYRYRFEPWPRASYLELESFAAPEGGRLRFEAEAEWPLLAARRAWATPAPGGRVCVSGGRVLRVRPAGPRAEVSWELPVPSTGPYLIRFGFVATSSTSEAQSVRVRLGEEAHIARAGEPSVQALDCSVAELGVVQLAAPSVVVTLEPGTIPRDVDYLEIVPVTEPAPVAPPAPAR